MKKIYLVQVPQKPAVYVNSFYDLNDYLDKLEPGTPCQVVPVVDFEAKSDD